MGDVDRGHLEFMAEVLDLGSRGNAKSCVQIRQGLVHEKNVGLANNGTCERNPLSLAPREFRGSPVKKLGQFDHLLGPHDPVLVGCGIHFSDLERKPAILERVHVRVQGIGLEDHGGIPVLGVEFVDPNPINRDLAFGYLFETGNHAHGRCLAAS